RRRRWSSLKRRTWSSSSRRRVPANRSANAFMSGASGAIRTTRAPDDARTRVKRAPSFASRSQTNTAGTASRVAFRACCAHHSALGAYGVRARVGMAGSQLSDRGGTRGRGSPRRPGAWAPERATACLVPAEDCRRLDEQRGVAPRRRHACCEPHREALPPCPSDPPRELSLRDDELLPKQGVLGDETGAAAYDVGGRPHHEPKDLDHAARCTACSVRMAFVARTGQTFFALLTEVNIWFRYSLHAGNGRGERVPHPGPHPGRRRGALRR